MVKVLVVFVIKADRVLINMELIFTSDFFFGRGLYRSKYRSALPLRYTPSPAVFELKKLLKYLLPNIWV